ncbi:hypothetical protein GCM10018966_016850 [Streptomyces yanii]
MPDISARTPSTGRGWSAAGRLAVARAARQLHSDGRRLELAAIPADDSLVPDSTHPPIPVHRDLPIALATHRDPAWEFGVSPAERRPMLGMWLRPGRFRWERCNPGTAQTGLPPPPQSRWNNRDDEVAWQPNP